MPKLPDDFEGLMDIIEHSKVIGSRWVDDMQVAVYNDEEQIQAIIKLKSLKDERAVDRIAFLLRSASGVHISVDNPSTYRKELGEVIIETMGFEYFDKYVRNDILTTLVKDYANDLNTYSEDYAREILDNKYKVLCRDFGTQKDHVKWAKTMELLIRRDIKGENVSLEENKKWWQFWK